MCRDEASFPGYVALGIALWISLQSFVSIAVNLGILPTKGLTLPLISSGGSSVLMTCVAIGLLLRVSYEVDRAERLRKKLVSAADEVLLHEVAAVPLVASQRGISRMQSRVASAFGKVLWP